MRWLSLGLFLGITLWLSAVAAPRRFVVGAVPRVSIHTLGGQVEVTAHEAQTVELRSRPVVGRGGAEAWRLEAEQRGDEVVIQLCCGPCEAPSAGCPISTKANLSLKVPAGAQLEVTATSALVSLVGLEGFTRVETVSGAIAVEGSAGKLDVSTVSGNVGLAPRRMAETRVTTERGNVRVKLPREDGAQLVFNTVSGTLDGKRLEPGSVERALGQGDSPLRVDTVSGGLELVEHQPGRPNPMGQATPVPPSPQ